MSEPKKIEAGCFVRFTDSALMKLPKSTPTDLLKIGWPNKFYIWDVIEDDKLGTLLVIDPCCKWMVDHDTPEPKNHLCKAHPAKYFERIDDEVPVEGEKADPDGRYAGIKFAGEDIISIEHIQNGAQGKALRLKLAGMRPMVLTGTAASAIQEFLNKHGVF